MNANWFLHRSVRHSVQMRRHVRKLINAQRDLLKPGAREALEAVLAEQQRVERGPFDAKKLQEQMAKLEAAANQWLRQYPNPSLRENIEVLLVAIGVAMGIRTFILQPFKIPTGSMEPTLFGITSQNLIDQSNVAIPHRLHPGRFFDFWFNGVGYTHAVAEADGKFEIIDDNPSRFLLFNLKQRFSIGGKVHTVWFPPEKLWERAGLQDAVGFMSNRNFKKGQDVIRLRTVSGDHLLVDRFTYNFRRPRRGEIIVFETRGIRGLPPDQYYIKRMVAMGGEKVRIGNDRHLIINDHHRLDASTPHFELVYSFDPKEPPKPSQYSGHVNATQAREYGYSGSLAPLFRDETSEYKLQPNQYIVMGDNTVNSYDSRAWGAFPRDNVIGQSFFVYWPIGTQPGRMGRFGWSHR